MYSKAIKNYKIWLNDNYQTLLTLTSVDNQHTKNVNKSGLNVTIKVDAFKESRIYDILSQHFSTSSVEQFYKIWGKIWNHNMLMAVMTSPDCLKWLKTTQPRPG